jgi:2-keto-4-pentenoate hydratase/2-oxohepta-3-ene-1,7-dioic acid hydratase in catechol pathway
VTIICVGRNYADHAKELGNELPKLPLLFFKPASSIIASGEPILIPEGIGQVDYEGELAFYMGQDAFELLLQSDEEALSYIDSFCLANDVTARELQKTDGQWLRAKGFKTFLALGDRTSIAPDLSQAVLKTSLNGVLKQSGSTKDFIFSIRQLLNYISWIMPLNKGDLILTGTPSGVGPLTPGDSVTVEMNGLPTLTNPVLSRPYFVLDQL